MAKASFFAFLILALGTLGMAQTPFSVPFTYQIGGPVPNAEAYSISGNGGFTLSITGATSWAVASLSSSTAPAILTISVNPAGLAIGSYSDTLSVVATGANTLVFEITLLVEPAPPPVGAFQVQPTSLALSATTNGTLFPQTVTVNSSGGVISYVASTAATWLTVIANGVPTSNGWGGTTPGSITVFPSATGLSPGTYTTNITLTSSQASNSPLTIPVTLTISAIALTAAPSTLSFQYQQGGTLPGSQSVTINSNESFDSYSATSTDSWISFNPPTSAFLPATMTVSVNPTGMAVGTFSGKITLQGTSASLSLPISLTITAEPTVMASPTNLSFSYQVGQTAPTAQLLSVSGSTTGDNFTAQVATASGGNWLSVTPKSGTTPSSLDVSVNGASVSPGTYQGTITISGTNGATGTTVVEVALTVSAPIPNITAVVNAASYANQGISPGELITVFGTGIGPTAPLTTELTSTGNVSASFGSVTVLIGGTPAPLTYVSAGQINCVVPYEIVPLRFPTVQVQYLGQASNFLTMNASGTSPGIFATNGTGQGAILNQNGSLNGSNNPEVVGNVITIYMTGEGQIAPAGVTGSVTCGKGCSTVQQIPVPVAPVSAFVANQPATILFYGEAPGLVSGVLQVNLVIPPGSASGANSLVVSVGGVNSQPGVTVAVR